MRHMLQGTVRTLRAVRWKFLYRKYKSYTMALETGYWHNLVLVDQKRHLKGCVVECGVWRGGMSAGMAEVLGPERDYFLFDSFEGLQPATELDGQAAKEWQSDTQSPDYYDNCAAPIEFAQRAMKLSGAPRHTLVKGWFEDTLPDFVPPCPIAVLRLDGDWYESTMTILENLYKHLEPGALVLIDDYVAWDGCSRAVHDFLSQNKSTARITQKYGIGVLETR